MTLPESMRFALWAQSIGRTPSIDEILAKYPGTHRATAYRWRAALLEAWGVETRRMYLHSIAAPRLVA